MHETRHDVITAITAAALLFAVTFPPALLWASSKHLLPRCVREAARSAVFLAFLLISPSNGTAR
jgi:hypothetical protein